MKSGRVVGGASADVNELQERERQIANPRTPRPKRKQQAGVRVLSAGRFITFLLKLVPFCELVYPKIVMQPAASQPAESRCGWREQTSHKTNRAG